MASPTNLTREMINAMLAKLDLEAPGQPSVRRTATEMSLMMQQAMISQKLAARSLEKKLLEDYPFETKVHPDWRPKRPGQDVVQILNPPTFSLRSSALKPSSKL